MATKVIIMRKGMGKGQGKGYKNLTGRDPRVHSMSAKGIKQPQRFKVTVPPTMEMGSFHTTARDREFESKEQEALWDYNSAREHDGLPPLKRMPKGTKYEKDTDGDGKPDKTDCEPLNPKKQGKMNPSELFKQLGGNKFVAMTGAKDWIRSDKDNWVSFRIPKAKEGINYVKITLNAKDLYDMEFGMIRKKKGIPTYTKKHEVNDVYDDMLQPVFTEKTGLYTSLGTMGR
jgi:hypothetical protein